MKFKIIIDNEVDAYVVGLTTKERDIVYDKMGINVENSYFMKKNNPRLAFWDGKEHFFEKSGKTYVNLLPEIIDIIFSLGYDDFDLEDKRKNLLSFDYESIDEYLFGKDLEIDFKPFRLRPYQVEIIKKCIEKNSGIVIAGTGAGKTSVTAGLSKIYSDKGIKTITIVPSSDLATQTIEDYIDKGLDVGEYTGTRKDLEPMNVVSTWESLQNNKDILRMFGAVIWDECVHPDTLVQTIDGDKKISELIVGDIVKTLNEKTNNIEYKKILKIHKNMINSKSEKRYKLKTDSGKELIITGNHKILTDSGWKRADELKEGDNVYDAKI